MGLVGSGLVTGPTVGAALLLLLGFQEVSLAADELVTDPAFVSAENRLS